MPYEFALYIHFFGLFALISGFALLQHGGWRLRHADSTEHARMWLGLTRTGVPALHAGLGFLFLSGLFMAWSAWSPTSPWLIVALCSAIAIGIGTGVLARRLRTVQRAIENTPEGPLPQDLASQITEPWPWIVMIGSNGLAFGVLWVMVDRPNLPISLAVVIAFAAVGLAFGTQMAKRPAIAARITD
ncbi:MAG TPA: hypothetical protein V6D47_08260 [Oscillatoriaceae cyanobacterium]